jgi:hypothetical protein
MLLAYLLIQTKSHTLSPMVRFNSKCKFTLRDITVILNYIFANPSMKNGETWTPICIPGITEDHILYVYMHFHTPNTGIIIVCTDHSSEIFFEC